MRDFRLAGGMGTRYMGNGVREEEGEEWRALAGYCVDEGPPRVASAHRGRGRVKTWAADQGLDWGALLWEEGEPG